MTIGILGGGISGISLAAQLDENVEVLEKRARIGGLCGSIIDQGFTFDAAGPHIMFSKNKEVLNLMVAALGDNVHQRRRENKIWFKGQLVKYPFENDLAALLEDAERLIACLERAAGKASADAVFPNDCSRGISASIAGRGKF